MEPSAPSENTPSPDLPNSRQAPATTIGKFLRTIIKSGVLDSDQLHKALQSAPEGWRNDPNIAASYLVKKGVLTRFQAFKLLQGAVLGLVLGPYEVLAQVGKGGMGFVYLARDKRDRKLLAIKVLPPKKAQASERLLARFQREMEICRKLSHPNLAQTYAVGVHEGVYYIAMEYIKGKNLFQLVSDHGPLEVPRAARLFSEVALGLEYAHSQGIIHRDMKPSNIMVRPDDHVKVLDLGLAFIEGQVAADRTMVANANFVVGTMDYVAPEQAEDSTGVDVRADIYSLGCTMFFALVRRQPFPGGTPLQKLMRHRVEMPTPIPQLNPEVPEAFADIAHRMMAKAPQDRFASAADIYKALQPWTREPEIPVAPTPAATPKKKPGDFGGRRWF